jgi:hypothetical protein
MSTAIQPDSMKPAKSSTGKIILIVFAIIFALGFLACAGIAAVIWFGWSAGEQAMAEAFKPKLQGNPVVVQEIGTITSMRLDSMASINRTKESQSEQPIFVMPVEGTNGKGTFIIVTQRNRGDQIETASLETSDGRTLELSLDEVAEDAPTDFTVDEGEGMNEFDAPVPEEAGSE